MRTNGDDVHVLGHQACSLGDEIGFTDRGKGINRVPVGVDHGEDIVEGVGLACALGQTDLGKGLVVVLGDLTRAVVDVAIDERHMHVHKGRNGS